jgi:predicted Zn finger-like uncharacterized protein
MSLVTRCPACATTFRVSPAQLAARGGRVRCGKCTAAFDGVAHLLTDEAIAALPAEPSPQMGLFEAREPANPAIGESEANAGEVVAVQPVPEAHPIHEPEVIPEPEPVVAEEPAASLPVSAAPPPQVNQPTALHVTEPIPAFLAPAPPRASHAVLWALLAVVAIGALMAQAALAFRTEIAVLLPPARVHLEAACEVLGCELGLPRRADLMSIESSDLQADPQRPGVIVLNALLRNRAPFAQEYPDLELTLTDQGDRPVIRRVVPPRDYLQQKLASMPQGLGGGAEEAVRIHLETGGLSATGYQLFLFYPCPPVPDSAYWQLSYPVRCLDSRNK